ncbi:MAG: carboxypeptidase-like regulatory domain-containing protein, partial [Calditrichaeota bacterium]|nr:carboxypeptidase-like regulatory domain-containing protein [Calditrichota bacterium]
MPRYAGCFNWHPVTVAFCFSSYPPGLPALDTDLSSKQSEDNPIEFHTGGFVKVVRKLLNTPLLYAVVLSLSLSSITWAGVTGKISGTVVDARTGEPIASANVVVLDTHYGAATSLDGEFYILNLKPGQYTVKASYVGYISITQEDVMVYADFNTQVEFS